MIGTHYYKDKLECKITFDIKYIKELVLNTSLKYHSHGRKIQILSYLEPSPPLDVDYFILEEDGEDGEDDEDDPGEVQPLQARHGGHGGHEDVGGQELAGLYQRCFARMNILHSLK